MRKVLLLAVSALLVAGGACSRDGLDPGDARLSVSSGANVIVTAPGRAAKRASGEATFPTGTRVKVVEGTAGLELGSGPRLELRRGSEMGLGARPTLVRGDLLVTTTGRRRVTVLVAGSEVAVNGAARLSRDLAVSAASYRGILRLRSAGRLLEVPALRQGDITSLGQVGSRPEPLDYDPADPWDRRFLGEAIELGEELEAKSEGFTSSLRENEGRTPGYFRLLLPALEAEPAFGPPLLRDDRPPGETLVGATIAVAGDEGSFVSRWQKVFSFRSEGAPWGLVALDQKVDDAGGLVQALDAAIGRANLAFAPPPGGPGSTGGIGPAGGTSTGGTGTGSGIGEPEGGGGGGASSTAPPSSPSTAAPSPTPTSPRLPPTTLQPPTLPPSPVPTPPPGDPQPVVPLQPVVDTIGGLLNGL